ncbi:hypothetical protein [Agromyces humi]|uniref:hypothetical protein n=1 Tax=Agromyces humi TaxID=1766800 RepID=UPI00135C9BF0|nr:hypothetical protein [Agromyces humi]
MSKLTARAAADHIREELRDGDENSALRLLVQALEHFRLAGTSVELEGFLEAPSSTGDVRWDTLLATVFAWAAERRGITPPVWTEKPSLPEDWLPATPGRPAEQYLAMIRASALPEFLERGILIRERDLTVA